MGADPIKCAFWIPERVKKAKVEFDRDKRCFSAAGGSRDAMVKVRDFIAGQNLLRCDTTMTNIVFGTFLYELATV